MSDERSLLPRMHPELLGDLFPGHELMGLVLRIWRKATDPGILLRMYRVDA